MLSLFRSEEEVGLYGAAAAITAALMLLPLAYRTAVFPPMSRLYATSRPAMQTLFDRSFKYLIILALPMAVGTILLADPFITLVYEGGFAPSAAVLRVLMLPTVIIFANVLNARLLVVSNNQWVIARSLMVSLVVNVLLNLILVPICGVMGVSYARLVSTMVIFGLNFVFLYRHVYPFNPLPLL